MAVMNAARGVDRATMYYDLPSETTEDVSFNLKELERVDIGKPFNIEVDIHNKSHEKRSIQVILSAYSIYYTGVKALKIKSAGGTFTMRPNQRK